MGNAPPKKPIATAGVVPSRAPAATEVSALSFDKSPLTQVSLEDLSRWANGHGGPDWPACNLPWIKLWRTGEIKYSHYWSGLKQFRIVNPAWRGNGKPTIAYKMINLSGNFAEAVQFSEFFEGSQVTPRFFVGASRDITRTRGAVLLLCKHKREVDGKYVHCDGKDGSICIQYMGRSASDGVAATGGGVHWAEDPGENDEPDTPKCRQGIAVSFLDGTPCPSAEVKVIEQEGGKQMFEVVLHETEEDRRWFQQVGSATLVDPGAQFDHGLKDHFVSNGFACEDFNIAVFGTNNTGKSTFTNTLMSGGAVRADGIIDRVLGKVDCDDAVAEQLQGLKKAFEAKDGRCTTWEMLAAGGQKKDVSVWFPNSRVWDLPGVELRDGSVDDYAETASINHFDLAVLVVEKALSTDDFRLLMHCQKARIDGTPKPGGVPFFLVKNKVDLAIIERFRQHIDKGNNHREFELDWESIVTDNLDLLLTDLEAANKRYAGDDPMQTQTEVVCKREHVIFTGLVEMIQGFSHKGHQIPFHIVEDAAKRFDDDAKYLRKKMWELAKAKQTVTRKESAIPCLYPKLTEAFVESGLPVEDDGIRELVIEIEKGLEAEFELGFGAKKFGQQLLIVEPKKGDDKRAEYGIEEEDVLVEFPAGKVLTVAKGVKSVDLEKTMRDQSLNPPFNIVIQRESSGEAKSAFRTTKFRSLYLGNPNHVMTMADYNEAVNLVIASHARKFSVKAANVRIFQQNLVNARGGATEIHAAAVSDWCSCVVLYNDGRIDGEVEFCSMVNAALRNDEHPAIQAVANYLQGMRFALMTSRGDSALPARTEPLPSNGILLRGLTMPSSVIQGDEAFFVAGKKYRNPNFMATTPDPHTADYFGMRSKGQYPERTQVLFVVDASSQPFHVNRINNKLGEVEFLWAPYSCFEVTAVDASKPVVTIKLRAFKDNKAVVGTETATADDWELAAWH